MRNFSMNYLYGSIAILLLLLGVEQYGEHRVKTQWDLESARLQALADQAKNQDKEINAVLEEQHRKDIQNAKSEAGKSAIREYIRTHGMLHIEGSNNQAQNSSGVNDASSQCGTSLEVEEFATRCGEDALKILRFQEWAIRENLEIEK